MTTSNILKTLSTVAALASVAVIANVNPAQALNLIENGGFENPNVATGKYGNFVSIDGWTQTGGDSKAGIEIQDNITGSAYEGDQFLELDSKSVSRISQTIKTVAGQKYKLNFAISPRKGVEENIWNVMWDGGIVDTLTRSGKGNNGNEWELLEYFVTATSDSTVLSFDNLNEKSDSLGAYLDDVSLTAADVVPTPAAILPGLFGMGLAAARKSKKEDKLA